MSIAVAAGINLVIIAIVAILVGISVVGRAVGRNENWAESEQDREQMERVSGEQRQWARTHGPVVCDLPQKPGVSSNAKSTVSTLTLVPR